MVAVCCFLFLVSWLFDCLIVSDMNVFNAYITIRYNVQHSTLFVFGVWHIICITVLLDSRVEDDSLICMQFGDWASMRRYLWIPFVLEHRQISAPRGNSLFKINSRKHSPKFSFDSHYLMPASFLLACSGTNHARVHARGGVARGKIRRGYKYTPFTFFDLRFHQ